MKTPSLPLPDEAKSRLNDARLFANSVDNTDVTADWDTDTALALDAQITFFKTTRIDAAIHDFPREDMIRQYAWHLRQWEPYQLAQLLALAVERLTLIKEPK